MCFNLKNPSVEIIDNITDDDRSTLAYDGYPETWYEFLNKLFIMNSFNMLVNKKYK